jgi:hypothetical protein
MSGNDLVAPPARVTPRNAHQTGKPVNHRSSPTVAQVVSLRSRRAAALRLPPLGDGPTDPLDDLAGRHSQPAEWGSYDVVDLGTGCSHDGPHCPVRRAAAV